jgi:hypothetical protein
MMQYLHATCLSSQWEKILTRIFVIRGPVLVIVEIHDLNPSIVTLESFKAS